MEAKKVQLYDIAILGAGCAGMTLAARLAKGGYTGSVVIVDEKIDFSKEQRWCSWGPVELPVDGMVLHKWSRFSVTVGGRTFKNGTPNSPYVHVHAPTYYHALNALLASKSSFTLCLDLAIESVVRNVNDNTWTCTTTDGSFDAKIVFDARNLESKVSDKPSDCPWLWQSFAGQIVSSKWSLFDPLNVILMDFAVPGGKTGAFVYLLPFSDKSALIESTLISQKSMSKSDHLKRVQSYIVKNFKADVTVEATEYGNIPMTTKRMPMKRGENYYAIGISGGAAKPSTGYAFSRIQQQCSVIADDIINGREPTDTRLVGAGPRRQFIDDVFIEAAAKDETFFASCVHKMFSKVAPDVLIRFLSDRSSTSEDLSIMAAVGTKELVKAALKIATKR